MRPITDDRRTNILQEQFIPDNVFIYLVGGSIRMMDGINSQTFTSGDAFIIRKNRLAKYVLLDSKEQFEPVLFCFDEPFVKQFLLKHPYKESTSSNKASIVEVRHSMIIDSFVLSIKPYYKGVMQLDEDFEDLKYEELLLILLKNQPELAEVLFDFRMPGKIDLEEFMSQNFKFNVSIERFAFLTGRSLSAFKRDFKKIFDDTPNHWLVQKRLEEAYFLLHKKKQKPSDFYIDLGFESLSHFSTAFKKMYGHAPTQLGVDS